MAAPHAYKTIEQPRRVEGLTRDEICNRYMRKVLLIARRIADRLPSDSAIGVDDLAGWGAIGLLEAFDRFDPDQKIKFSTFAEYRIRGAMVDALRTHDSFSRRRRQLAKRIDAVRHQLRGRTGVDPEPIACARELGMTLEQYHEALGKVRSVTHVSLMANDDEGRPLTEVIPSETRAPDDEHDREETRTLLRNAVNELGDRERQVILMYYGKQMSGAEIAAVYGVTVSRVSQILSAARRTLRGKLDGQITFDDLDKGRNRP
ncbi:MAG: sigma-70 family RNA polymerase sigma factor [Myxococcales bacterium]|nr:sigma-70 family RNA polymerase sigma factor [Myxococcales bacterium]MCA9568050.1 sigma-70 family RNA polymerase sigma factor [Myxococcales bacterium]MCB9672343.1 sigma-70 family RNA polymerase sigma factor [Alphaproteobacteria bacterium]